MSVRARLPAASAGWPGGYDQCSAIGGTVSTAPSTAMLSAHASWTSGLTTTEAGGQATFTARLNTVPTSTVTVGLASSDTTEGTVSPSSLTFQPNSTALNNQTVTVTGVDDAAVDGAIAYAIVTAAATSGDPAYGGLNPPDVSVTNQDNEVACPSQRPNVQVTSTKGRPGS